MKRLLKLVLFGAIAGWIASVVAALAMKGTLVPDDDPTAPEVSLVAIFGPLDFATTAQGFRGGSVECWYGGGVIDLREATLDDGLARLHVRAVFGGGQILVPDTWRVTVEVKGIGGVQDAREVVAATGEDGIPAPELVIEGTAIFGGFAVMSELR